ncbi:MAG: ferredoxin--NADP reductase [Flavobacteriaceae bacterium]
MKLVVKDIIKETEDALSVCFKNGSIFSKISYNPGQFLTVHVPIDGQIHKRAYSFSSSPSEEKDLKITIKRVEKGLVSNHIHDQLKIGDKINVDSPTGSFFVKPEKEAKKQYVFFAGGSGITPIFSILKSVLAREPKSKILLVYANQNQEAIIFQKTLEDIAKKHQDAFAVEHILTKNNQPGENYHSGLISNTLLSKIFKKHQIVFTNHNYMICGPFGYMEKIKELLQYNGVESTNIMVEVFKSPKVVISGKDLISDVEIKYNGQTHKLKVPGNKSILQTALNNNIVLPYACRAGMCVSCKAQCESGEVKMTDGHFLEQEHLDAGNILTCVSYPVTERVVIVY